ncbi:MAG: hypothetical protein Q8N18_13945 [Opitutaceae bacterium]|nr:hypothetical protein [Opitutaceae bacterium]
MNTHCCSTSRPRGTHFYRRPFGVSLRWRLAIAANRIRRRFHPRAAATQPQLVKPHLS